MTTWIRNIALAVTLLVGVSNPLCAASDTNETAKSDAKVFDEPSPIVTEHTLTLGGKTLKYHATAGFIVLKEEEGKPLAKTPDQKPPQGERLS